MKYLGGTGVGGGTLVGLSKLLVGAEGVDHIVEYADEGNLGQIDLKIRDLTEKGTHGALRADMTAANFGNVSDIASKGDIALGVMNLVFETVGMVSIFASRYCNTPNIVLTGNLTRLGFSMTKFEEFNNLGYGVNFIIPELSQYSTVIGCALSAFESEQVNLCTHGGDNG